MPPLILGRLMIGEKMSWNPKLSEETGLEMKLITAHILYQVTLDFLLHGSGTAQNVFSNLV